MRSHFPVRRLAHHRFDLASLAPGGALWRHSFDRRRDGDAVSSCETIYAQSGSCHLVARVLVLAVGRSRRDPFDANSSDYQNCLRSSSATRGSWPYSRGLKAWARPRARCSGACPWAISLRFTPSFRDAEDLLAERGVAVCRRDDSTLCESFLATTWQGRSQCSLQAGSPTTCGSWWADFRGMEWRRRRAMSIGRPNLLGRPRDSIKTSRSRRRSS